MSERNARLVAGIDLATAFGVEIGPLMRPVVRKSQGRVVYVDHVDTATLKAKYGSDATVDPSEIVDVDAVWGERTLAETLAVRHEVDYLIASHVIEHVPDLIGWLREIDAVMAPGGTLRLAVPDRRFTFDVLRRETSLPDVLDAYVRQARMPQTAALLDYITHACDVEAIRAWSSQFEPAALEPKWSLRDAIDLAAYALETGTYHDVHCWVFTPRSFALLFAELGRAGLTPFGCDWFCETEPNNHEFLVAMSRPDPADAIESWTRMAAEARDLPQPAASHGGGEERHLAEALDRARADLAMAEAQLAAMQASTSWRVTAPLRGLKLGAGWTRPRPAASTARPRR